MKLLLTAILTVALLVIGFYIYRTRKEKMPLARVVERILLIGWLIVLFNLISLLTHSEDVCLFAYSVYFVATDWLLYYLLRFSLEYIGNDFERIVKKPLMLFLLAVDSISVLVNNIFGHMFKLRPVSLYGGELFFELETYTPFYLHYSIIVMLVLFCLITLFYRSVTAPVFYRKKYLAIALITVAIVVMNIITMKSAVDVSVIGYVAEGIIIYYCALVYTPQKLLQKTLLQMTQEMSVAVLVLDMEGKKMYSNKRAEQFLSMEEVHKNTDGVTLEEWCYDRYMNGKDDFIEEQAFYCSEEEVIFKIQLQRMLDKKGQLQGGYFVIQDRTEEINNLKKSSILRRMTV